MMKMRKLFLKLSMLLLVLGMSVNAAWGQEEVKIYFASLKAQSSPESTGSGLVKLTWVDITGAPLTVELAKKLNSAAFQDPTWMAKESAYDGFGETAQVLGGTMSALDGMETMIATMPQIFMTSFVYYYAESQPANGSYLAEWTFTEPAITRMTEPMGGEGSYTTNYGSLCLNCGHYNNPLISPCFKVLPDTANNALYSSEEALAEMAVTVANTPGKYNNLYAVFNKYLLSNPQAENGHMNANESSATFKVSVDVEGDASQLKANYADFDFPASDFVDNAEGTWSWAHDSENPIEQINATKTRYNFTITFAPKTTSVGRKNATLTIRMAHADASKASTLNIPLSVDVRPAATADATLYDGKTPTETSGTLSDMIAAAHNTDKIVVLNRDYADALVLNNKNVTIDLNGYDITNTLTVSGGDVTIAYSKFGGQVSSVVVASGKLTLNGGTIETSGENNVVAVTVMPGATLVQNGAKIIAEASQKGAVGIYNLGTVTINEGSIYAESGYNTAVAVNAENGSTTYINGGSLSALAKEENGTEDMMEGMSPEAISTWTNAYAVNVAAGSTVEVNGGDLYAEATNAGRAYGVATLAGFGGNLTVNKKAVIRAKSPNYWYSFPVAVMAGKVTINGGKFDGHYTSQHTGDTINPAVFGVDYSNFTFISGTCKTDVFFIENPEETFAGSLLHPSVTLYKVTKGSKDYNDGYRNIAVADTINGNPATQADRIAAGVPAARIGTTGYTKLEDAIAYANNNPSEENIVIFMTNDYTLPAGYYTLPANATIVVPMSDDQAKEVNKTAPRVSFNDADRSTPYVQPTEFRKLTIASGVNMDVFGNIEMTCSQFASNEAYTGQPTGAYGHIVMEEGSHMTLQNGSEVRAWGFMTGKGEIDARRGSIVREMFQLGDWKGAITSVKIVGMAPAVGDESDKKVFPVTQYFIQNIESPVKYHPGSLLSTSAAVSEGLGFLSVSMTASDIGLIGVSRANQGGQDDPAIFLMDIAADAENTWVRKWYDVENDVQVYDINSGAHIGSMVLDMGELFVPIGNLGTVPIKLNSAKFDLPLTCNFKIHLLTGGMDFKQNTCLLPGAEVEVDKEATVSVAMNEEEKTAYDTWVKGGKVGNAPVCYTGALYVYDAQDWSKYAYVNAYGQSTDDYSAYTKVVRYSPSWNGRPTVRDEQTCPDDAKINVRGTFQTATGFVYTSVGNGANSIYNPEGEPTGGANIFSTNEDAGTFIFNDNASAAENPRKVYQVKTSGSSMSRNTDFDSIPFYPARLRNGNGTYVNTDEAVADLAYCYQNDKWSTMIQDGCFMKENRGGVDIYYAKPQEYVALANGKTENKDHTYSDAAGAGRLFILMDDHCQWWEVENVDNLYHCVHPNNDTYYYWGVDPADGEEKWLEKKFTITWKNWNGDIIQTANADGNPQDSYEVTYGTMAEFLGTNPTREKDADSTYNFTGWKPALGPVTQDVTYTATFQGQERKYTITFINEGGTLIETQFLTHKAIPVCENTPTKVGHILQWSPAIGKVVADATYTATWLEEPPTKYEIRFLDYDGTLLKSDSVAVGEMPVPPVFPSNKPETAENTYTCSSWDAEVLPVTEAVTYTAVYTPTPKAFSVKFITYNGSDKEDHYIIAPAAYKYGETPVAPTKEQVLAAIADENTPNYTFNNDKYTYSFAWDPQIQTVLNAENNTYTATIDSVVNQYTVTLKSNLSGVCTFTGAGTFDYGTTIDNVAVSYNSTKYTFNGWSDSETTAAHPSFTLAGDITLTANFTPIAIEDHTVTKDATWNVPVDTEVKDLILTSDGSACGQLLNPENLTIRGEAIFRMAQSFAAGQWYAVAVPWRVNPATGIYGASGRLASGSQIYIIEFDGAAYANVGGTDDTNQYWHFLHETGADMVPGKLYMIYLRSAQSKLDFHKKAGAALQTRNLTVSTASGSAGASFANWNAISNPALYTADLSTGAAKYQTYDNNDGQTYTVQDATTNNLIVAKPIFVQVTTPSTVYATVPSSPDPAPAYRRAPQAANDMKFVVEISCNGKMADRLIVETADEKENRYVIGQDLAKFGVSSKVAQMWVNRYDAKLCANTVAMDGERAEYPLSIYAPAAGDYTIANASANANAEYALYLTRNGEAIWNLSEGDYVLSMEKGTSTQYGLRISVKAPQNATGVDEAIIDAQGETRKVLINDKVYIIRGDKVYSVDGQLVK